MDLKINCSKKYLIFLILDVKLPKKDHKNNK